MKNLQFLLFFFYILLLVDYAYSGTRHYTSGTKYDNNDYVELFKVQASEIKSIIAAGISDSYFKTLINRNFTDYWISPQEGKTNIDPYSRKEYYLSKFNVTFEFKNYHFIDKIIYQAYSAGNNLGIGYPEELNVYCSKNDEKFSLVDSIKSAATDKKVVFILSKYVYCDKINLEWKKIKENSDSKYKNKATLKGFIFLYPEKENINETLVNAFDKSDYRKLTLIPKYKNWNGYNSLFKDLLFYMCNTKLYNHISRIINIRSGQIKYDPKREFSTDPNSKLNIIERNGALEDYARDTLKMDWAGTDRQVMGIYARPKEKLTIFVKAEQDNNLPEIKFSQYLSRPFLSKSYSLKKGEQIIVADEIKLQDEIKIPTYPGGPVYFINPYTPEEQGKIYVYIEGGIIFPTFRLGGNVEEYKRDLAEWVEKNRENNKTYFDITELYSMRTIFTLRATFAYKIYSDKNNISPQNNLIGWDKLLKDLYEFDGLQFNKGQPYYNEKNNYIRINYRYSQPFGEAYAAYEHVGIFYDHWIERALNFNIKEVGWGFIHETGHMMDISERKLPETSNNMISEYYDAYLLGNNTFSEKGIQDIIKYLSPDNIDNKLRACEEVDKTNCKGFLSSNPMNFLIFWDLECFHHGYWGKLDNLYRYNNSLPKGISKEEIFVYFSSIIFKFDLGYYFTRWGFSFNGGNTVFDEKNVSTTYSNLMKEAINKKLIDPKAEKKKIWYFDKNQYTFKNIGNGCYKDKSKYDVQITSIAKKGTNEYVLTLPKISCNAHLGFEIYEGNNLIGFTHGNTYTDQTTYKSGYTPKYKIIAYDRLLEYSKPSTFKSPNSNSLLKAMNLRHFLNEN